jgi:hypothetical protein
MTWSNGALAPKKTKAKRVDTAPASIVVNGGTPYGRKALEDECDAVESAVEGERNNRLNQAAFALGQLVAGGELNEHDARNSLRAAAAACGLGENEREKTIASGLEAGKKEPRSAPELPKAENDSEPAGESSVAPKREHSANAKWEQPIPLDTIGPLPTFPVHCLPPVLRDWVVAEAEATQTPVELAACVALGVLSACAAGSYEVEVRPGYVEPGPHAGNDGARRAQVGGVCRRDQAAPGLRA